MVDILARLKIRAEEFSRGSKAAFGDFEREAAAAGERASSGFGQRFSAGLTGLLTGAAASAVISIGKQALDQAKDLKQQSQQLSISTDALQEYRYAAEQVGVSQADLSDGMADLLMKIADARSGSKDAGEAFRGLGIDVTSASGSAKSTADVIAELIGRISGVSDPMERARAKTAIFGDGWRQIDPLLSAGAARVHGLREAAHQFGIVISEDAIKNADETARKMSLVRQELEAKMSTVVLENSDAIMSLANALGWAADKALTFVKNMQGVERLKRDEGWAAGFFSSWDRQKVASDPVKYLQSRTTDLQSANGAVERLVARKDNSRAGKQALSEALERQQEARRLMEVARQEVRWKAVKPDFSAVTGAASQASAATPASGSSRSNGSGRAASGKTDAERALEQQKDAEDRLRKSLEETIQQQQDSQKLSALRARDMDREADIQEALLDLQRRFPGIQLEDNKAAAAALGIRESMVPVARELYELAKAGEIAAVKNQHDIADAEARVETERKAQEEIQRLRDAADERQRRSVEDVSRYYFDLFSGHGADIWRDFKREGMEVISVLAAQWTIAMMTGQKFDPATALGSAGMGGYGGPVTSLASAVFNGRGRGDSLAELVAKEGGDSDQVKSAVEMSKSLGSTSKELGSLNKYLAGIGAGQAVSGLAGAVGLRQSSTAALAGSAIGTAIGGPLGGAIGGLVAGTLGGMLKKTKKGSASINIIDGEAAVGDAYGNSASYRRNATALGGSVADQLNSIADMLGGDLSGTGAVSIGQRKKKFVVDTAGTRKTKGAGTLSFSTEEEAVEAAVRNMLEDGILGGVSAAATKILRDSSQTLEKALTKAQLIEAIPDALQARLNPVQYAIDQLNEKWDDTWAALKEGAATAEQMAEAQQLYNLELEEVKNTTAGAAQGLKDFITSMDMGSASPLSLRDQDKAAYDALTPYLNQINSGQSINQDAYMDAAQTWLEIQRQLYGSTAKYFESFDTIQSATAAAIADIEKVTSISTASDAFNQKTASATAETAANTSNIAMLLQNGNSDLGAKLDRILAALTATGFVGGSRGF